MDIDSDNATWTRQVSAASSGGGGAWDDAPLPSMARRYADIYGGEVTQVGDRVKFPPGWRTSNGRMVAPDGTDMGPLSGAVNINIRDAVREVAPANGLLVDPSTGKASFKFTSEEINRSTEAMNMFFAAFDGPNAVAGNASGGMSESNAVISTLQGGVLGLGKAAFQMVAPLGDLLQVANELGRHWATGEPLRDINYISSVGQMAGAGASTSDIVNGGFLSLMSTPDRIVDMYNRGHYSLMGEEIGGLGLNAGLAMAGMKGTIPTAKMGLQLAVEDFGASGLGQRVGSHFDQMNYQLGHVNYVVAPRERVMNWSETIPETSPYVTPYDPRFPGRPDPAYSIDTSRFSSGTPTSGAGGGLRNSAAYWKTWVDQVPGSLSPDNLRLAQRGLAPEIDSTWVSTFPQHKAYLGDDLIHHHTNFGRYAIPVPGSTHTSSSGIWHLQGIKP
jgi:hypothetical protein